MIRLLLLAFPRAWRRRYGQELADLVAEEGLSPSIALDLARAGMIQRGRQAAAALERSTGVIIGHARRHPTGWALAALLVMLPTVAFVAGSLLAYQLALVPLRGVMDPVTSWLNATGGADLALVAAPAVAIAAACAPLLRLELRRGEQALEAAVAVRLQAANLAVVGTGLLTGAALGWYFVVEVLTR